MPSEPNTPGPPDRRHSAGDNSDRVGNRLTVVTLVAIVALGAALRLWGLGFGLPHGFSRPDEEKIVGAALGVLQGDFNPHMFLYPSLFIYANAAVYWLLFVVERAAGLTASRVDFVASAASDPTMVHFAARFVAAACGTATIAVLYASARELFPVRTALIASGTLAVVFLHVRDSHFGVTDVPVTLLTMLAWWSAVRTMTRGLSYRRIAVTGVLCGLAASTKYNAALVVVPATIAIVSQLLNARRPALPRVAAALLVLYACTGAAFLLGTPYSLLDRAAFLAEVDAQRLTAAGLRHGTVLDPARLVVGERGWTHHLTFSLRFGLGLPLLVTALAGAAWMAVEGPLVDWLLVFSFPLMFYAAMGSSLLVYPRWMVPVVPFLCLAAAVSIDRLGKSIDRLLPGLGRGGSGAGSTTVMAALTLLVAAPTAARAVAFDRLLSRTDTRVRAAEWIEGRFPDGASIYQTGMMYGFVEPHPKGRYPAYTFNERHDAFAPENGEGRDLPDLIVVLRSPLVIFNKVPSSLDPILRSHYTPVAAFKARSDAAVVSPPVYDQQDAFYVPFANFGSVSRPGPDIQIFERIK